MDYLIATLDSFLEDVLDLVCHGYGEASPKCAKMIKETPIIVDAKTKKQSLSVLLPLVDIVTSMGAAP